MVYFQFTLMAARILIFFHDLNKFLIVQRFDHKKPGADLFCQQFKIRMFDIIFLICFFRNNGFKNKSFGCQVFYAIIQVTGTADGNNGYSLNSYQFQYFYIVIFIFAASAELRLLSVRRTATG